MTGLPKVGYNHRFIPVGPTAEGMTRLREWAFGKIESPGSPNEAISEGTWALPPDRVTSQRKGCSPDWVIIWTDAILIVEFKTKASSMTLSQVEEQLTVLRHHHPSMPLLHLYVTPVPATFQPSLDLMMRYRNISWSEFVEPLLAPFPALPDGVALGRFVAAGDAASWWQ
ncbi:MAG: hypothetical protein K8R99_05900 [Actinomycetia bacterium]|nr:hypothetical protein [Actinomycetes bacterium]